MVLDYPYMLKTLEDEDKNRLATAFNIDIKYDNEQTMIVMSSVAPIRTSDIKEYNYLLSTDYRMLYSYRLFIDFCCNPSENIIMKPHPYSNISHIIDETFEDIISVPEYCPFDFLPLIKGLDISKVYNVGSSAIKYVNVPLECTFVHRSYFNHYPDINAIFVALDISEYLSKNNSCKWLRADGWDKKLRPVVDCMPGGLNLTDKEDCHGLPYIGIIEDVHDYSYILDEFNDLDTKSSLIVVNPKIITVKKLEKYSSIIKMGKNKLSDAAINYVGTLDPEYVLILSKDSSIHKSLKKYNHKKKMLRCEIELKCHHITLVDFINEKLSLTGNVVFRSARMGNAVALENIWKWINETDTNSFSSDGLSQYTLNSSYSLITDMAHSGNENAMGYLGRMYRDGKGVEKDPIEAAEWLQKAAEGGVPWARREFLTIQWEKNTYDSLKKMVSMATNMMSCDVNNGFAMRMLGLAYRDGKGVKRDLYKAADLQRKADKELGWVKNELFDTLWRIGTPESYKEMISVAMKFAEEGNGSTMGRLGRAYREGRGVEKNLDKAIEWMRKAAHKDLNWARNELFDLLWRRGEPEDFIEAKAVAEISAKNGDMGGMGRLGRAYREGRGVEKNLDKAIEWIRKASPRNNIWKKELGSLLKLRGLPEDLKEINATLK